MFRWARGLAFLLGIIAAVMLLGVMGMVWGVTAASEAWWLIPFGVLPLVLACGFLVVFARRLPTAFAAVQPDGVRVHFPLSVDTTIPFADVAEAVIVTHHLTSGLGIRTNLAGRVRLATAGGPAAELTLRKPVRASILPYIWWTHARELRLTVERPDEFVAEVAAKLESHQRGVEG